jgi:hypothetical protein
LEYDQCGGHQVKVKIMAEEVTTLLVRIFEMEDIYIQGNTAAQESNSNLIKVSFVTLHSALRFLRNNNSRQMKTT